MLSTYKQILPITAISDFVEKFWLFENNEDEDKEITILPDGCFELLFKFSESLTVSLLKPQIEPATKISKPNTVI